MLHTRAVKWMVESPALGRGWRQALAGTHHVAMLPSGETGVRGGAEAQAADVGALLHHQHSRRRADMNLRRRDEVVLESLKLCP